MGLAEIVQEIDSALLEFQNMFESLRGGGKQVESKNYSAKGPEGNKYHYFYYPREIARDAIDGFRLISSRGFVSIKEEYRYINTRELDLVGYTYRYITPQATYSCADNTNPSYPQKDFSYNFHFDMDLEYANREGRNDAHHEKHLQILHSHPRFKTERVSVAEFLKTIKLMCFDNGNLALPFQQPIYLID